MITPRLIDDFPRPPALAMAVDEVLLDGPGTVLRFTRWSEPCVTLGRFQPYTEFEIEGAIAPTVRRISGGGAILHHRDATFAIAGDLGGDAFPARSLRELAERAATGLRTALSSWWPELDRRGGPSDERGQRSIPDCFDRRSPFDLVAGSRKIAGLALHRRGHRVLIQASARIPEHVPALLAGEIAVALLEQLSRALDLETWELSTLTPGEETAARALVERRYGCDAWSRRR